MLPWVFMSLLSGKKKTSDPSSSKFQITNNQTSTPSPHAQPHLSSSSSSSLSQLEPEIEIEPLSAAYLPPQALLQISQYLVPLERLECLLVCKAWSAPVALGMYKDLELRSSYAFEGLAKVLVEREPYHPYALLVRSLDIGGE
jgi:hypothetical protein